MGLIRKYFDSLAGGSKGAVLSLENSISKLNVEISSGESVDLGELEEFRYKIYINEMKKKLPEADHYNKRLPDVDDKNAFHFIARKNNSIVGCVRLHLAPNIPSKNIKLMGLELFEKSYTSSFGYVSKLMISRDSRGTGIGFELMRQMIIFGHGDKYRGEIAFFHSNPRLAPFYERIGFRRFGSEFIDPHVGVQIPMHIIGGDTENFQKCRSPLTMISKKFKISAERLQELMNLIPSEIDSRKLS